MKKTINEEINRWKNLMNINESVDEGVIDFARGAMDLGKRLIGIRTPEEKKAAVIQYLESGQHPNLSRVYAQYQQTDPAMADKYVNFFVKYPNGYPKWNGTDFVEQVPTSFLQETQPGL